MLDNTTNEEVYQVTIHIHPSKMDSMSKNITVVVTNRFDRHLLFSISQVKQELVKKMGDYTAHLG